MKATRLAIVGVVVSFLLSSAAAAQQQTGQAQPPMTKEQQAMMDAWQKAMTPGPQHKMLAMGEGNWTFEATMWMDPAAPPTKSTGTVTQRVIMGGRYVQADHKGTMMGMPFEGTALSGYDNVTGKYQSAWWDNLSTMIMLVEGTYDEATRTFTYKGEVPDPVKPSTMVAVRQVIRIESHDRHVMEWYDTREGKETKSMEIVYTRAK